MCVKSSWVGPQSICYQTILCNQQLWSKFRVKCLLASATRNSDILIADQGLQKVGEYTLIYKAIHVSMFMQWSTLTITNMFYILICSLSFFLSRSPLKQQDWIPMHLCSWAPNNVVQQTSNGMLELQQMVRTVCSLMQVLKTLSFQVSKYSKLSNCAINFSW